MAEKNRHNGKIISNITHYKKLMNNDKNISKNNLTKNKLLKPKVQEFFEVIKNIRKSNLLIIIKGYPDPDSIASSLAFKHIATYYEISSTILYFDKISHKENRALVKTLGISMIQYDENNIDLSYYDYVVFSDTQTLDLPVNLPKSIKPLALIDHHKDLSVKNIIFKDIREDSGSTAAIYTEYLMYGEIDLKSSNLEDVHLASALMHGIRTDTNNFILATEIDFLAAAYLSHFFDRDLLSIISHQSISIRAMNITQTALENKVILGTYLFSGVGFVREEDRDGIAQAADYLLRREGIETVIIYGVVGKKFVDGSLRTTSHSLDPDQWIKNLFGLSIEGKPYGGGRRDKGGFQIPLGVFIRCGDQQKLWSIVQHTIQDILCKEIGIVSDSDESSNKV